MNPDEENNFISNYQQCHFQEKSNDLYKSADTKRKCLMQTLVACHTLGNEDLACDILEQKLREYSDLVDDQSGVNNYATSIQALTSNLTKPEYTNWKNEINISDLDEIVKSLTCCKEADVPEDEIQVLFQETVKTEPPVSKRIEPPVRNVGIGFKAASLEEQRVDVNNSQVVGKRNNCGAFKTARDELEAQNLKKYGSRSNVNGNQQQVSGSYAGQKKSLGARRGIQSKFIPPLRSEVNNDGTQHRNGNDSSCDSEEMVDERLKNIEPRMVELIKSEIMDSGTPVTWDDIAGLEFAKTVIKEVVVWPLLRPDIFTGLRRPPKGILLFGPPGTGKTLIGKCIASQSQSTFFSISASSLTSKWIGEGEKMVRALFTVARCYQPAVIFIDEIDSLLSQRSETEHESSRRIKTEFLVQLDGATTGEEDRILVTGATNRPQELDEAARRRFVKRLYIPLPEKSARLEIVKRLMNAEKNELTEENMNEISELSDGYSGADMKNLCAEASLGPIRSIDISMIQNIQADQVRAISMNDFRLALSRVRASVSSSDLDQYIVWDKTYGAGGW